MVGIATPWDTGFKNKVLEIKNYYSNIHVPKARPFSLRGTLITKVASFLPAVFVVYQDP